MKYPNFTLILGKKTCEKLRLSKRVQQPKSVKPAPQIHRHQSSYLKFKLYKLKGSFMLLTGM